MRQIRNYSFNTQTNEGVEKDSIQLPTVHGANILRFLRNQCLDEYVRKPETPTPITETGKILKASKYIILPW